MGQPSSKDEMTIRHQFDRLCQMALKGEAVNYYKHMDYRRKHEVTFSELSEKELSKLFTMDEYGTEYHHFEVHGYDIEVKNTLIAETSHYKGGACTYESSEKDACINRTSFGCIY